MRKQGKKPGNLIDKNLQNLIRKRGEKLIIYCFPYLLVGDKKSRKLNWKNGEKNLILIDSGNELSWK